MGQKSRPEKQPAEDVIKDIRRVTRRHFSAEDKIRIVLEGLRGEDSIAELDRRQGHQSRPQHCLPDGRGRHSPANAPGDFAADRRAAAEAAACASLKRPMVMRSTALTGGLRLDAKQNQKRRFQERYSWLGMEATGLQ